MSFSARHTPRDMSRVHLFLAWICACGNIAKKVCVGDLDSRARNSSSHFLMNMSRYENHIHACELWINMREICDPRSVLST